MMAKTKIYFWLKVDKKFFDNLFIKRLKNMPGGYTMTVIYIRLMLESLEDDCILYYEGYFDSLVQELALKLDVSEDDINMTVAYFTKCGLIQIDDDGHATLSQAKAMVESETNWAKYKRDQRKNSQNLPKMENVQNKKTISNSCPTEIEIDKESDKDKELYKEYILSGKPDFTFPNWLTPRMIEEITKGHPEKYLIRIPLAYLNHTVGKNYKYLRPETLFGSKFDGYLNQKPKTIKGKSEDNFPDLPF